MLTIELPFPPAILSGHANGNDRWKKVKATAEFRELGKIAVTDAGGFALPAKGDIPMHIHFIPPDRRGDRWNYVNRMKGAIDGIAEGLGVNDRRFLPSISYAEPEKPGRVIVTIGG